MTAETLKSDLLFMSTMMVGNVEAPPKLNMMDPKAPTALDKSTEGKWAWNLSPSLEMFCPADKADLVRLQGTVLLLTSMTIWAMASRQQTAVVV